MTLKEARDRAAKLGLSAWVTQAVAAIDARESHVIGIKCVGFASAGLPLAEAETWEGAFTRVLEIIFGNLPRRRRG